MENNCLLAKDDYGRANGWWMDNVSFEFDGIKACLLKDATADMLRHIEDYVLNTTGYKITLKLKPMDDRLNLPEDLDCPPTDEQIVVMDDNQAAEIFYQMIKPTIKKCEDTLFVKVNGLWTDKVKAVDAYLCNECINSNILMCQDKDKDKVRPYSANVKGTENIVKAVKWRIPNDPGFIDRLWSGTRYRVAFSNGYYQFTKQQCPPTNNYGMFIAEPNKFDTTLRIEREFPPRVQTDIDFVYDKILTPAFDHTDYLGVFLHILARAFAGCGDKLTIFVVGLRDSSKSKIFQLIANSLEKYYAGFPAEVFLMNRGSGDAFRNNSYVFELEFARLAGANEIKCDRSQESTVLDGNELKKRQDGSDPTLARRLHQEPRPVKTMAMTCFMLNDFPTISPADTVECFATFKLPNKFVSKQDKAAKYPFDTYYKEADSNVRDWVRDPAYTAAFLHILFEAYRPEEPELTESMLDMRKRLLAEGEKEVLNEYFEITGSIHDCVLQKDAHKVLKTNKINMGPEAFLMEIERRVRSKVTADHGEQFSVHYRPPNPPRNRVYRGIKIKKIEGDKEKN